MPNHDGAADAQDPRMPERARGPATPLPSLDLAAALGGLDRATRNFNRRLGETLGPAAGGVPPPPRAPGVATAAAAPHPQRGAAPRTAPTRHPGAEAAFEARLRDAEREAREYLERAKQRADTLVATMVRAVEQEAGEIRRDAEIGIRNRWRQVEIDANRHLEEARRVGDGMVAERQDRLAVLSDAIAGRAEALTSGLADADRVRMQFDAFVRALSVTADRIASDPGAPRWSAPAPAGSLHNLHPRPQPSALAA